MHKQRKLKDEFSKGTGLEKTTQIGLGILAIIVSGAALFFPGLTVISLVILLAVVLIFVGIEKIISGIFIQHKSRWATVGLGVIVIILASIALAFPVGATVFLIFLMAFALMFDGFARIIHGFADKQLRGWSRGFSIGVGILAVVISVMILVSPFFGCGTCWFLHRNSVNHNWYPDDRSRFLW